MRYYLDMLVGLLGSAGVYLFGGWNTAMQTLILMMIIDYITGLITAGVFKKSKKSKSGSLSSKAGLKGLCKKVGVLLLIVVAYRMDIILNLETLLYNAVVIGFIANEAISILENCTSMGIPIPKKLEDALETMKGDD